MGASALEVFLVGLGAGVCYSQFGLLFEKSSNLVGQPLGRDSCLDSSWGLCIHPGYVKKVKLVWCWVILNSLFRFCIWHTAHLLSVICDASKSRCGGRIRREASSFPFVGLVFYLFSCVGSSLYVLF